MLTRSMIFVGSMLGALAIIAAPGTAASAATAHAIEEFEINFDARMSFLQGETTLRLRQARNPGEYVYENRTQARGMARMIRAGEAIESSHFRVTEDGLQPIAYDFDAGDQVTDGVHMLMQAPSWRPY